MTAVKQIDRAVAEIKSQRVEWLAEKPRVPPARDSLADFLDGMRAEYAWYRDQRDRLECARRAISSMIEDCEFSMQEAEEIGRFASEAETTLVGDSA